MTQEKSAAASCRGQVHDGGIVWMASILIALIGVGAIVIRSLARRTQGPLPQRWSMTVGIAIVVTVFAFFLYAEVGWYYLD